MTQTHDEILLGFPKQIKIATLEQAGKHGNFGVFIGLAKVLLDAPISKGGIATEEIEAIHDKYF